MQAEEQQNGREDVRKVVVSALEEAGIPDPGAVVERLEAGLEGGSLDSFTDTLAERADYFLMRLSEELEADTSPQPDSGTDNFDYDQTIDDLLATLYPL